MVTTESLVVGIYVAKTCPEHWIVLDHQGRFWMVPPGQNPWERRQPFQRAEDTELEPIPGHYKYVLGLPA